MSLNINDADGLVHVGHELIAVPLADERPFCLAGVCQGTGVCMVSINSAVMTEDGFRSFHMVLQFIISAIVQG